MKIVKLIVEHLLNDLVATLPEGFAVNSIRKFYLHFCSALPFAMLARAGETVIHIGCWKIETVSAWSRLVGPRGKVIIIEPVEENINLLSFEASRRSLDNVIFINSGVWSSRCTLPLMMHKGTWYKDGDSGAKALNAGQAFMHSMVKSASTYIDEETPEHNVSYEEKMIRADTLDNLLQEAGVSKADHIHITTTGSEFEILSGMECLLTQKGLRVMVSATFLRKSDGRPSFEAVEKLLRERGLVTCLGKRMAVRHGRYIFAYTR